jgi:hypothetical protein
MAIILDFTGLFYQISINLDDLGPNPTVKDVTEFAVGKPGDTGGMLIRAKFSPEGYLSSALVEHASNPLTRQKDIAGNLKPVEALPTGIYGFTDTLSTNRIPGVEISFTLSWQYYIFRDGKLISGTSATSPYRTIVPASLSATATPLEPNDIVRWKLVAIGGLQELIEIQMTELNPSQRTTLMSRVLKENLTVRETAKAVRDAVERPE